MWLLVLFLLTCLNWGIEALKWHHSIRKLQPISYWRSFKAILSGVSFAVNTPNRTGEYLGRILYVEEGNRLRAVAVTILNSWSQLLITLIMGWLALWMMAPILSGASNNPENALFWVKSFRWMLLALVVFLTALFFRPAVLVAVLSRIPWLKKYRKYYGVMGQFSSKTLGWMLLLSFLRYLVFLVQYQVVFSVFEVGITWWQGFWSVSAVFLVMSMVPTIALAELGLRGEVSLQLVGLLSKNKIGIVAATSSIWFVNLLVPAFLGSMLLLGLKIFRNK
jgi:hypothetical protein